MAHVHIVSFVRLTDESNTEQAQLGVDAHLVRRKTLNKRYGSNNVDRIPKSAKAAVALGHVGRNIGRIAALQVVVVSKQCGRALVKALGDHYRAEQAAQVSHGSI
jgi:hypothetical protein